jgi:hypothetical protein
MPVDLTKLSDDELIALNRRIVERLQLLRSAKSLTQLAKFSVGMVVEFDTDDGRTVSGTVARLNRRTATIVARIRTLAGQSCAPARRGRSASTGRRRLSCHGDAASPSGLILPTTARIGLENPRAWHPL